MQNLFVTLFILSTPFSHGAEGAFAAFVESRPPVTIRVELAENPAEWGRGLMFRDRLESGTGMLFIFPGDAPRTFWMKNVKFPIDIIFLDRDLVIRRIWKSVPPCGREPCELYTSGFAARYALETEAGFCDKHGVTENQRIEIRKR